MGTRCRRSISIIKRRNAHALDQRLIHFRHGCRHALPLPSPLLLLAWRQPVCSPLRYWPRHWLNNFPLYLATISASAIIYSARHIIRLLYYFLFPSTTNKVSLRHNMLNHAAELRQISISCRRRDNNIALHWPPLGYDAHDTIC